MISSVLKTIGSRDCLYPGVPGIHVMADGHLVSRVSDFIMYSVEAEFIDRVVAEYGPCRFCVSMNDSASLTAPSNKGRRNRIRADLCEGTRKGGVR